MRTKKAQEEIVGFALIVIIVTIILIFLLIFSLKAPQKESVESYEVESFLQASLQYTTDCVSNSTKLPLSVQELIFECGDDGLFCEDERMVCDALNDSLRNLAGASWPVGDDRPVKGYELIVSVEQKEILKILEGATTKNYKGASQFLPSVKISFTAYY